MARKLSASFSKRVATLRKCLRRLKNTSTRCLSPYICRSYDLGFFLFEQCRITATLPRSSTISTKALLSYPLSVMTNCVLTGHPSRRSGAAALSAMFPPVKRMRRGLPRASTTAWILVEKPPRERPSACFCCPLLPPPHVDGRVSPCCQA